MAILDPKGNVKYIQIVGEPDIEFFTAWRKALEEATGAAAPEAKPPAK